MEQTEQSEQKSVGYYFLKSKDVHMENGLVFITFFARLTREFSLEKEGKKHTQVQTVWVKIDELKMEHASKKERELPNCMQRYELSYSVFKHLYQLSKSCPTELFYITPYHRNSIREKFIT